MFTLCTDSACCMSADFVNENDVRVIPFSYSYNDNIYYDNLCFPTSINGTASVNAPEIADYVNFWRLILSEGKPILHISSAGIFNKAYKNAVAAGEIIHAQNSNVELYVISSDTFSCGCGLLMHRAAELRLNNTSAQHCAYVLCSEKYKTRGFIMTSDCHTLNRAGIAGTLPMLRAALTGETAVFPVGFDESGVFYLRSPADILKYIRHTDRICISHCNAIEGAEALAAGIFARFGLKSIEICPVSSSQQAIFGNGTVALFFRGNLTDSLLPVKKSIGAHKSKFNPCFM